MTKEFDIEQANLHVNTFDVLLKNGIDDAMQQFAENEANTKVVEIRIAHLNAEQQTRLDDFVSILCQQTFEKHVEPVKDGVTLIFDEPFEYYRLDIIEKQIGFLPTADILLKSIAQETIKFGEVVESKDEPNNIYVYFKNVKVDEKYIIFCLTAEYVVKTKPKKNLISFLKSLF